MPHPHSFFAKLAVLFIAVQAPADPSRTGGFSLRFVRVRPRGRVLGFA